MKNIKLFFNIILISMLISVHIPIISHAQSISSIQWDKLIPLSEVRLDVANSSLYSYVTLKNDNFWGFVYLDSSTNLYTFVYLYPSRSSLQNTFVINYYSGSPSEQVRSFEFNNKGTTSDGSEFYYNIINRINIGSGVRIADSSVPMMSSTEIISACREFLGQIVDDEDLGFIKPSYFVDSVVLQNSPKDAIEYITWQKESTSGIDITTGEYQVEFMLEDKTTSMYNRSTATNLANDIANVVGGVAGTVIDFASETMGWLASNIFPYGSDERSYLQGKSARYNTYGQAINLGSVSGAVREFSFSAISKYKSALESSGSTNSGLYGTINALYENNNGGFWNTLFNTVSTYNQNFNITYDIYARIVKGNQKGQWLKINRHNRPLQCMGDEDALNGGITVENGYDFSNFEPNSIWRDLPQNTGTPQNTDLPTGYHDSAGNNTVIYNNYTYNYDNRSWIENHYDNQIIEDVNQGFDILKNFGMFGNWFEILFGALLPDWCLAVVSIVSPIFVALIIFRVVKGVIPFV